MKHTLPILALGLAFTASVDAGTHTVEHVKITHYLDSDRHVQRFASGNIGDIYNSINTVEMISCDIRSYNDGYESATCYARAQNGETLVCVTDKEAGLRAISRIQQDSRVQFQEGRCETITVTNGSLAAPKRAPTSGEFDPTAIDPGDLEVKQ